MKLLLVSLVIVHSVLSEDVNVETTKGTIKGSRTDFDNGKQYFYEFKGIRYAKPPVEELRFKAPVENDAFTEVFDATTDGNICPQYDVSSAATTGDEDCLNLNVYTPKVDNKKRAVLVYIHGGAFIMGGGASYFFGPNYIIEHDVILVTLNYRLGAFGFLATDDKAAEGNMGILDQILALKWVQKNIEAFGGDPKQVTVFGEDAGAASASILTLSPLAEGLFQRVILLSGNALCDQFMQANHQESAVELANRLECSSEEGKDIVTCLSRQTQQDIVKKSNDMTMFFSFPRWFAPIVDGKVLPDTPENILKSGKYSKVPIVIGQTKDEGGHLFRLTMNSFNNGVYDDNFVDHKFPRLLPVISEFSSKLYPLTRAIRKKYFVNVDMENEDEFRPRYIEFLTDMIYTRCVDKFAKLSASNKVPTYQYVFDYRGQYSIVNLQGEQVDMGVVHGDELQYIFSDIWGEELSMSAADIKFSKNILTKLITNFAKTGNPTPEKTDTLNVSWPSLTTEEDKVLRIGGKLKIEENYKKDYVRFWLEDVPKIFKKKDGTKKKSKDEL